MKKEIFFVGKREPDKEAAVQFIFPQIFKEIGIEEILEVEYNIERRRVDYIGVYKGKKVRIEIEFLSSSYKTHLEKGDIDDLIICWIKDKDWGIPTIELRKILWKKKN